MAKLSTVTPRVNSQTGIFTFNGPLMNDLIKNAIILIVIEILQKLFVNTNTFGKKFIFSIMFSSFGFLIFYILVDPFLNSSE
jgi:hypothetical protein